MEGSIDRREFFRSSLIRSAAGLAAMNELLGPGMIPRSVRFVSAAERGPGSSFCEVEPAAVSCRVPFCTWSITYTSGTGGLPLKRALAVRCAHAVLPEHHLTVTSSFPAFDPVVTVKNNIGIPRVIWIEPGGMPLPPGEKIVITLKYYPTPLSTASCAFWILEADPDGGEPEIGSGLTFLEVPAAGGGGDPRGHAAVQCGPADPGGRGGAAPHQDIRPGWFPVRHSGLHGHGVPEHGNRLPGSARLHPVHSRG